MVYGVLGGFFAYLTINWQTLYLIRGQLACIFATMTFFVMLFSIGGVYGFPNFCGAFLGGYSCSLGISKPIKERNLILVIGGLAGVGLYWLMMFLIFYLALWILLYYEIEPSSHIIEFSTNSMDQINIYNKTGHPMKNSSASPVHTRNTYFHSWSCVCTRRKVEGRWRQWSCKIWSCGSTPRPLECKSSAVPSELQPIHLHITQS